MASIDIADMGFSFGSRQLFDNLSFSIEGPSMVALMGPSGSGKSTLLSIVSGLIRPQHGRVQVANTSPGNKPSWIFQTAPLLNARSVHDNVEIGGRVAALSTQGEPVSDQWVRECLQRVRVDHLSAQRAGRLSGGEKQRVVVARAICSRAEILLADEPTASLDRSNRDLVCDALREAVAGDAVVLIATHDTSVAERCDAVLNLDQPSPLGLLQQHG